MVQDVFLEAGITAHDLGLIAVTVGPGSFTGVRTALAAAEGLAAVTGCRTVGVSSLHAIWAAWQSANAGDRDSLAGGLVAVDARRGEAYAQSFAGDGTPTAAPALVAAQGLAAAGIVAGETASRRISRGTAIGGLDHASVLLTDLEPAQFGGHAGWLRCLPLGPVQASWVATLALADTAHTILSDPARPLYLRAPDAKPQRAGLGAPATA